MEEKLLQYIWANRLFNHFNLTTAEGLPVEIIDVGALNTDSGADFKEAKIKIGRMTWAGSVELHVRSSDWFKHNHQVDKAYSDVILHVVYEHDQDIPDTNGNLLPTVELKPLVHPDLIARYNQYMSSALEIVCQNSFEDIPSDIIADCSHQMLIQRLEQRKKTIKDILRQNNGHQEEAFYFVLANSFGFKTNSLAFGLLAKSLPLMILGKHKYDPLQIEALLFGMADLLPAISEDDYTEKLRTEYLFLQKKFGLEPLCRVQMWKFSKLYPSGFPTVRIAQFAALVCQSSSLLSKVLEVNSVEQLYRLLNVTASDYWTNHYRFGVTSAKAMKKVLGKDAVHSLIINTVLPFMYACGSWRDDVNLIDRCIGFYADLPLENNAIVRKFSILRPFSTALHSQALMQLFNHYCKTKRCLECRIGTSLIKN